jgi:ABC-type branched-subunit amino acid transport system substrate-binding protein
MRRRAARLYTTGLVIVCLLLAACSAAGPAPSAQSTPQAKPIVIGDLADVTGAFALNGAEMHVATDLAVAQINQAGGINGRPLQVQYADPKSDPTEASQLATQFVQQDNVDVLVGAVSSAECAAVEDLAPKLGVVYVSQAGCASDEFTSKTCNKYTFRMLPTGPQLIIPLSQYLVQTYGKRWAVMYSDYAFGQSQLRAFQSGITMAGGTVPITVAVPLGEANVTPYVTRVPTDGSIDGLVSTFSGSDEAHIDSIIQQFQLNQKLPIVGGGTKEHYGGVYPEDLDGTVIAAPELSNAPSDNANAQAFDKAFTDVATREPDMAGKFGGADKAVAGQSGYPAYVAVQALKAGMVASGFTGRSDTAKLIAALEGLNTQMGPDFPYGGVQMSASDHQGKSPIYIFKVSGQQENILMTIPASQLPPIGTCQVGS